MAFSVSKPVLMLWIRIFAIALYVQIQNEEDLSSLQNKTTFYGVFSELYSWKCAYLMFERSTRKSRAANRDGGVLSCLSIVRRHQAVAFLFVLLWNVVRRSLLFTSAQLSNVRSHTSTSTLSRYYGFLSSDRITQTHYRYKPNEHTRLVPCTVLSVMWCISKKYECATVRRWLNSCIMCVYLLFCIVYTVYTIHTVR